MKKILTVALALSLVFASASVAQTTGTTDDNAMTKLGRGLLNILDAIVEVPGTMMRETEAEGAATGMTKGVVVGVVNTLIRALVGAYEVATFPVPVPEGYAPIMDDPKFLSTE